MTKTHHAIATALLFAAASSARAEDKKPAAPAAPAAAAAKPAATAKAAPATSAPPAPAPSKELEAFMKPLEGSWKCDSTFAPGAFGPATPELKGKSTVKFKKDYNGFVYRGEYEMKKQKGFDMAMKGTMAFVWDSGSQQILSSMIDSGGGIGMSMGKPEGDTLTLVGESHMMGMKMKTREIMGKKSDKEIFHKEEVDMGKGWTPMAEDTCKK
jgi:hypothetical protein